MKSLKALIAGAALGMTTPLANAADWQPKPVEFIIMAGTGGGADQIARLLQGLIEQKVLSSALYSNKQTGWIWCGSFALYAR